MEEEKQSQESEFQEEVERDFLHKEALEDDLELNEEVEKLPI